jgi:hypothetical protein
VPTWAAGSFFQSNMSRHSPNAVPVSGTGGVLVDPTALRPSFNITIAPGEPNDADKRWGDLIAYLLGIGTKQ